LSKFTILIVDDEKYILELMTDALESEDYTVIAAESGEDALTKLKTRTVDLIISDQAMKSMDGLSFLKQVKTEYPHIITIMLTGYAKLDTAMDAINEAGVYKFFEKPCSIPKLKTTVRRALELQRLIDDRDLLLDKIKGKDAVYQEMERKYPGITQVDKDSDGYIVLE
jgi:DNA-binding NtrC family response regulator